MAGKISSAAERQLSLAEEASQQDCLVAMLRLAEGELRQKDEQIECLNSMIEGNAEHMEAKRRREQEVAEENAALKRQVAEYQKLFSDYLNRVEVLHTRTKYSNIEAFRQQLQERGLANSYRLGKHRPASPSKDTSPVSTPSKSSSPAPIAVQPTGHATDGPGAFLAASEFVRTKQPTAKATAPSPSAGAYAMEAEVYTVDVGSDGEATSPRTHKCGRSPSEASPVATGELV